MILVIAEERDGTPTTTTREAIVFAQHAARDLETSVEVLSVGSSYDPSVSVDVLKSVAAQRNPTMIVSGHTTQGMDFMPRLAVALRSPLAAGCVDYTKVGDHLVLTR